MKPNLSLLRQPRFKALALAWNQVEKPQNPGGQGWDGVAVDYPGLAEITGFHPRLILETFKGLKAAGLINPMGLTEQAAEYLEGLEKEKKKDGAGKAPHN